MHEEPATQLAAASLLPHTKPLPSAVWGVILTFFLVCTALQYIVLLDFGPDEPWHLDYGFALATKHQLPLPPANAINTQLHENHLVQHPPLYYLAMAGVWKLTGTTQPPRSLPDGYAKFDQFEANATVARRLIRLGSTLLGCLTLLLIARTLALLDVPKNWMVFLIALAVASPMFQYTSSVANNENLAYAFSALVCFVLVARLVEGRCSPRQALLIGLLCGCGTMVKQTTMFVIPLAFWVLWVTATPGYNGRLLGLFGLGGVLTGIWWPLHNILKVGDPFPTFTPHPNQPTLSVISGDFSGIVAKWVRVLLETTFLPDWSLMFVPREFGTLVTVSGTVLLTGLFFWGLKHRECRLLWQVRAISFTAMPLLLLGVLQYCALKDQRAQLGGRYLLNSLPWAVVFSAASLPVWARGDGRESEKNWPVRNPAIGMLILLGFFVMVDLVWWWLVWTQYGVQIERVVQLRGG